VRVGQVAEADIAERGLAAADQDRRAVEQQPVDQIRGEERRRYGRAALDEDMVDGGEGGDVVRRGDDGPIRASVTCLASVTPAKAGVS